MAILCGHSAAAGPITLTFDDVGSLADYDAAYGIAFQSGGIGTACGELWVPGPAGTPPKWTCLPDGLAFIPFGELNCLPYTVVTCTTMDVPAGFTGSISFQHLIQNSGMSVVLYSEPGGAGTLIKNQTLGQTIGNCNCDPRGYLDDVVTFQGIARSARFIQGDGGWFGGFDNMTLDVEDAVPEPATLVLFGAGLLVLAVWRRSGPP